jgi:hypothetical protein
MRWLLANEKDVDEFGSGLYSPKDLHRTAYFAILQNHTETIHFRFIQKL